MNFLFLVNTSIISKNLAWFVDSIIGVVCGRATPVLMLTNAAGSLKITIVSSSDSPPEKVKKSDWSTANLIFG